MTRRRDTRLTRREFIATATAAVVVAGCAPFTGSSTARKARSARAFASNAPVVIGGDATIPASLLRNLASALSGHGGVNVAYTIASPIPPPDLFVTFGGSAPKGYGHGVTIASSDWALVSHQRVPVESVTRAQAQGLLSGTINDWSAVGAPYGLPVSRVALDNLPTPSGVSFSSVTHASSFSALLDAIRATPGAVAAIPAEAADWSTHHLGVDGLFPTQGRGTGAGLGALPLRLYVSDGLAKQGADPAQIGAAASKAMASGQPALDMVAVGDIMLGRGVLNQMLARNDFRFPYRSIHDELSAGDLRVGNLECMVTGLVQPPSDPSTFTFVCPPQGIDGLTYAGFNIVTLANNHSNGEGQAVFNDMRAGLTKNGILHCGGGDSLAEATTPAIATAKGMRVAILSYDNIMPQGPFATDSSWGLAPIDTTRLPSDIAAARQKADIVIPY
ncbi:MAG: CapA family protein, partial [Ktedonobacterales bacterium]